MIKITITKEIDGSTIFNLLTCALEGGSNYWIDHPVDRIAPTAWIFVEDPTTDKHYPQEYPLNPGGELVFISDHEENGKKYRLNLETIQKGFEIMADKYPQHFADAMNEDDNGDADTGDAFLQCCLFGETIFG